MLFFCATEKLVCQLNGTSQNERVTKKYVIKRYVLKGYMSHNSTVSKQYKLPNIYIKEKKPSPDILSSKRYNNKTHIHCLSVRPSVHPSVYLSVGPSTYPFVRRSVYPTFRPSVRVRPPSSPLVHPLVHQSVF
jgi:hypothetical protein